MNFCILVPIVGVTPSSFTWSHRNTIFLEVPVPVLPVHNVPGKITVKNVTTNVCSQEKVIKYLNPSCCNENGANVTLSWSDNGASNFITYNGPASFDNNSKNNNGDLPIEVVPVPSNNGTVNSYWDSSEQSCNHTQNQEFDEACQQLQGFEQFEDFGTVQQNSAQVLLEPSTGAASNQHWDASQGFCQPQQTQQTTTSLSPISLSAIPAKNESDSSYAGSCYESDNPPQRGSWSHDSTSPGFTSNWVKQQNANLSFEWPSHSVGNSQQSQTTGATSNDGNHTPVISNYCTMPIYGPDCNSQSLESHASLTPVNR